MEMVQRDIYNFKGRLLKSKISCVTRPLLADVYIVQFRRGCTTVYFFKSHDEDDDLSMADFLIKPSNVSMRKREYSVPGKAQQGVAASRRKGIADKLCVLMPADRRSFWENLPSFD